MREAAVTGGARSCLLRDLRFRRRLGKDHTRLLARSGFHHPGFALAMPAAALVPSTPYFSPGRIPRRHQANHVAVRLDSSPKMVSFSKSGRFEVIESTPSL